jgi:four helix bundle protein
MATIKRFEEIRAWQTARELTRRIYETSNQGAFASDFGLRNQMRRAAVSVMSNVAEGFESDTQAQFIKYLGHAKASAGEVRAQLYVALDVGHIDQDHFKTLFDLADKASRQLSAFIAYLKQNPDRRQIREPTIEYEIDAGTLKRSDVQTFKPSNVPTFQRSNDPSWDETVARLQRIFERRRILRAIVFGSFARDEVSRRSDVDLLLVQDTTERWLDRYDPILREVSEAVPGRDVDVLIYTPEELDRVADRPLIARALREGKTIYASDEEPT